LFQVLKALKLQSVAVQSFREGQESWCLESHSIGPWLLGELPKTNSQIPKEAGKKLWGNEITVSEFSKSNNCKDPR
jgi:hypothetical protein